MRDGNVDHDRDLVANCLSGSQDAWNEFYRRFSGLIRTVVVRKLATHKSGHEDLCQDVFVSMVSALKTYDFAHPLSKFVCVVAERVCIDNFRFVSAAKRSGDTQSIENENLDSDHNSSLVDRSMLQDDLFCNAELKQYLKLAFRKLAEKCRKLISLRYEQELQFREIAVIMGSNENTVTVQTKRCIDELRARYAEVQQKGAVK